MTPPGNIKHISHPALLSPWDPFGGTWTHSFPGVVTRVHLKNEGYQKKNDRHYNYVNSFLFPKNPCFVGKRWWKWFIAFWGFSVFGLFLVRPNVLDESNLFHLPMLGPIIPSSTWFNCRTFEKKPTRRRRCQHASATRNGCDVGDIHSSGGISSTFRVRNVADDKWIATFLDVLGKLLSSRYAMVDCCRYNMLDCFSLR